MNKTEFMSTLEKSLGNISQEVKGDILYDYQEHFSIGMEKGKTEEEISEALGDPKQIARAFKAECALKNAENSGTAGNVFRAVFAALGLGFFNLIFTVGPFLAVIGVIAGLFATALGILVSGLALVLSVIISPLFPGLVSIQLNPGIVILTGTGLSAAGALGLIGMYYLTRLVFKGTLAYLKMNYRIITGRRNENV